MALRVLLADESSTIKKAIQMVLSDYGVEIKSVPSGLDVMTVAQSFKPDVVLADVLLSKKNGYEIARELKNNPSTRQIPIIIMWSNFMQLDQKDYDDSGAEASLEKPFDTDTLRDLIESLVPKLASYPLKGLLKFPSMPDFVDSETMINQKKKYEDFSSTKTGNLVLDETPDDMVFNEPHKNFDAVSLDADSEIDEFTKSILLAPLEEELSTLPEPTNENAINEKTNASFGQHENLPTLEITPPKSKLAPLPNKAVTQNEQPQKNRENSADNLIPEDSLILETENLGEFEEVTSITTASKPNLQKKIKDEVEQYLKGSKPDTFSENISSQVVAKKGHELSLDEQLLREEILQTVERICWQIIPEIAEKVTREEITKLMHNIDKNL